jgi:hypothetical protein
MLAAVCLGSELAARSVPKNTHPNAAGRDIMIVTYDIFRKLPAGEPVWVEAVQGLEDAQSRLRELVAVRPGDYYIYDLGRERIVAMASSAS